VIARLWLWLRGVEAVSPAWLESHRAEGTKLGWLDGPVWRTPRERIEMARVDRRKAMAVVPMRKAAK
jgi:hypothetical protein